jgi:ribonuclease R
MIAIHAHDIPTSSRRTCSPPPTRRSRRPWTAARTGAGCRWSPSTRPTPRIMTTPSMPSPIRTRTNTGGHIVSVAIADVAAYVRAGSPLDREALKRGNSVYFPDRVVPMLPERISNDLCSLREGEDRPALAVSMTFARPTDGRIRHSFHRVMMKLGGKTRLSAGAGGDRRHGRTTRPAAARRGAAPLWDAYAVLASAAATFAPPLELDLPERKILLKPDGTVDRVIGPRTARRAQADRGVHDPGQCRGGRDAGEQAPAADLPRP